jgi:hypothetical protein
MTTRGSKYRGTTAFFIIYSKLVNAALAGGLVTYKEVARVLGIRQTGHHMANEVGQVLGEISEDEHGYGRPLLSALAVSEKGIPGEGFWTLARRLGRFSGEGSEEELRFWHGEQGRVYETWQLP